MRKYFVLVTGILISINAFGQKFKLSIDSVIDLEIEKHKTRHVSSIGYTKLACVHYGIRTSAYLFWTESNKSFLQKFCDSEYDEEPVQKFYPIEIVDSIFFPFYTANHNQLFSEEVESFAYRDDTSRLLYITRSHSCFRHFKVIIDNEMFDEYFDFFDLREFNEDQIDNSTLSKEQMGELKRNGWAVDTLFRNTPIRNINYERNNVLKIVEWDLLITEFIERIESEP